MWMIQYWIQEHWSRKEKHFFKSKNDIGQKARLWDLNVSSLNHASGFLPTHFQNFRGKPFLPGGIEAKQKANKKGCFGFVYFF